MCGAAWNRFGLITQLIRSGRTTTCHLPICGDAQSDVDMGRHYGPGWLRVRKAVVDVPCNLQRVVINLQRVVGYTVRPQ